VRATRQALLWMAAFLVVVAAGCGSTSGVPAMHVEDGSTRLNSLLLERGVRATADSTSSPRPLRAAWRAFKEFVAVPVNGGELSDEPLSDSLLFEYGLFGSDNSFELSLVRQLATADGDLQQVHLDVRFASGAVATIEEATRARKCADEEGCAARCVFGSKAALFGTPCAASPGGGRVPRSVSAWSFDTGGSGTDEQRASWIRFVEGSLAFQEAAFKLKPLRYEVWQDSAE
jgi:hypothetical protein